MVLDLPLCAIPAWASWGLHITCRSEKTERPSRAPCGFSEAAAARTEAAVTHRDKERVAMAS